jgi:negative regulator of flagellin synthesis FlgM
MKIEGSGIKSVVSGVNADEKSASNRSGPQQDAGPSASTVKLSGLAARMREIESRLGDTQVVDTARVEEIKQAITEGRFKVNPEVVADKLIDTVRELISASKA